MKIFVTGADGMLGSNLVRELLKRSFTVRAFVQPGRQQKTLEGLPIERFYGNLLNLDQVLKASEGCSAIIHTAASTNMWPARSEIVSQVNIEGTKNVIHSAIHHRINRMVYVGTASSFGFGTKQNPGTERNPYQSKKYGLDYMDTKYEAQQEVLRRVKEDGLPAVIVSPTFMLGPYDSLPSSGAMILAIYQRRAPGYTSGGKNYVCVKDAAVAIANALTMGRVGECYILGNQNLSYKEAFAKIAGIIGVEPPGMFLPSALIKAYGFIGSLWGKISGNPPAVSYPLACIACDEHYFSSAKAIKELDLPQTPIEKGIEECFDWLKENGYIKNKKPGEKNLFNKVAAIYRSTLL